MAAVGDVGDVVDSLRAVSGIAARGAQVGVPEPRRHDMHRNAGLQQVPGPVGAQRVRMREALKHARCDLQRPAAR